VQREADARSAALQPKSRDMALFRLAKAEATGLAYAAYTPDPFERGRHLRAEDTARIEEIKSGRSGNWRGRFDQGWMHSYLGRPTDHFDQGPNSYHVAPREARRGYFLLNINSLCIRQADSSGAEHRNWLRGERSTINFYFKPDREVFELHSNCLSLEIFLPNEIRSCFVHFRST
jgi:hypothetical protein